MGEDKSTREEIMTAAKKLFAEYGYHKTSMAAICREAGCSKGTLYWHFNSKNELFIELLKNEENMVRNRMEKLRQKNYTQEELLKVFIETRIERMLGNKKIAKIFLDSENYINIDFKDTFMKLRETMLDELEIILKGGMESGVFRRLNFRYCAEAILGIIHNMTLDLVVDNTDDKDERIEFLYDFIMDGLSNKKRGRGNSEED